MRKSERVDDLRYMQEMLRELAENAKANRDNLLGYLIEMAYVEASDLIRKRHQEQVAQTRDKAA